jgi:anti-sigma regulatory factor (Ser/Thr protein kinase)
MARTRTYRRNAAGDPVENRVEFGELVDIDDELPEPPGDVIAERAFTVNGLAELRSVVGEHATRLGVAPDRTADFVLAVDELACNSVQHGGGHGDLRLWREEEWLVCEIKDKGILPANWSSPARPSVDQARGRGLWLAEELCDLVEIQSSSSGTVVRARVRRP